MSVSLDLLTRKVFMPRQDYLLFRQSQFSSFSVSGSREVYVEALRTLAGERDNVFTSASMAFQQAQAMKRYHV